MGLPQWLGGRESACNAEATGDADSVSGSGRSPGEGNDNPHQCSCLENFMDRGAWQTTVHGVAKKQLRPHTHRFLILCESETHLSELPQLFFKDFKNFNFLFFSSRWAFAAVWAVLWLCRVGLSLCGAPASRRVPSLVAELGLRSCGAQACGPHCSTACACNLPRGVEPASPVLVQGLFTIEVPGKLKVPKLLRQYLSQNRETKL